jgi:hypothetical protein
MSSSAKVKIFNGYYSVWGIIVFEAPKIPPFFESKFIIPFYAGSV